MLPLETTFTLGDCVVTELRPNTSKCPLAYQHVSGSAAASRTLGFLQGRERLWVLIKHRGLKVADSGPESADGLDSLGLEVILLRGQRLDKAKLYLGFLKYPPNGPQ